MTLPALAAGLLALWGCADKPPADDDSAPAVEDPDPAEVELSGACPMEEDFGGFVVAGASPVNGVEGKVADGVVPTAVLEEIGQGGDCQLLRRNNPFCDPACAAGQTCDFDGTCLPYPANQDLGVVTLRGLVEPVELEPVFPGYTYFNTSLPELPFTPGELVVLEAPDASPAQTLYGVGVEPLESADEQWVVEEGVDLVVRWASPSGGVPRSEVGLRLSVDQHGVSPSTLYCTFEDDGEGVVPAALTAQLIGVGVTGFPSGALVRRTLDHGALAEGCMDLEISSTTKVPVDVDGYTPCISTEDCPDDLECNLELQICQ